MLIDTAQFKTKDLADDAVLATGKDRAHHCRYDAALLRSDLAG